MGDGQAMLIACREASCSEVQSTSSSGWSRSPSVSVSADEMSLALCSLPMSLTPSSTVEVPRSALVAAQCLCLFAALDGVSGFPVSITYFFLALRLPRGTALLTCSLSGLQTLKLLQTLFRQGNWVCMENQKTRRGSAARLASSI